MQCHTRNNVWSDLTSRSVPGDILSLMSDIKDYWTEIAFRVQLQDPFLRSFTGESRLDLCNNLHYLQLQSGQQCRVAVQIAASILSSSPRASAVHTVFD